jgi:TetR/AcrR family transcriptional regulator, regulator of cefoperazone and chloramphenicol sensitivity
MAEQDQETRERLLNAAARLFAERGFAKVTVRDICQKARANVAAVNYHFGGKDGLYHAVMRTAIETMQATTEAARCAGHGLAADERIRAYVSVFIERILGKGHETWIHQLMLRELSDPTPALDMVAEDVLKPRTAYLCGIIGELIHSPADSPQVMRCALSVQSQFNSMLWSQAVARMMHVADIPAPTLDEIAEHITQFSLGGIRQVRPEAKGPESSD